MQTAAVQQAIPAGMAEERKAAARLPWHCLAAVLGAACIPIGALWDISWHSTIGRDTFWTPAHITIHLGGLIPGFTAGWLALRASFGPPGEFSAAVRLWRFRAPIGAWIIIWGAFAMLLSAPFDNWWHNAYGLDVEILSPPHVVLAAGMYAVAVGALLLVLSWQNRTASPAGSLLFVFAAGILLTMSTIIVTEKSYPNQQRGNFFYAISCTIYPLYLIAAARGSKLRWSATGAAAVYMTLMCLMIWILPLFKAQPMLAPIYNPVDRMVPPSFPLLLIIPGVAIDLVILGFAHRRGFWWDCALAIVLGAAFSATFFLTQYHFSKYLISPAADNWFFAGGRWLPYFIKPGDFLNRYWEDRNVVTAGGLAAAMGLAMVQARVALAFGKWMTQVRR